jgi:hypothetical protein
MRGISFAIIFSLFTLLCVSGSGCASSASDTTTGGDASATLDASVDVGIVDDSSGSDTGTGHAKTFTIGGSVSGLSGSGFALTNGSETLPIGANGSFTFKTSVASGATYAVKVATQPSAPTQTCVVTKGSGVASANVTNVLVACVTSLFKIGGTVTGLAGTGAVLQDSNGDDLSVTANGPFAFATGVGSGNAFSVTVKTQPSSPTQTCTVSGGTGTVGGADVTSVVVNCQRGAFTVGGQISGLNGTVVLLDNAGGQVNVTSNGDFAFGPIVSGTPYSVSVLTQPTSPVQTCVVTSGAGSVAAANVTSVRVVCTTNAYVVGGTVSGLSGTGFVLQDNGGESLAVPSNGSFAFVVHVPSGSTYAVTVLSQPTRPSQTCAVVGGTGSIGAANVTNVSVVCTTNSYTVGGTVSGLVATAGLVLQNNGGDNLPISASGSFSFPTSVTSGGAYAVTIVGQPSSPAQTCTVSGGTGNVGAGNVTSVTVNCATNTYAVGGTVSGLSGTVVLENNGGDDVSLTANGTFAFATPVASGATYAVTVLTQPGTPSQTCVVGSGSGTILATEITSVTVTCTTNAFKVTGSVSGLAGGGLVLQDNGADNLAVNANGSFAFLTSVSSGGLYAVTVSVQPTGLSQTCVVTGGTGTGTVGATDVTSVVIACTTNTYAVGGTVTGLAGGGLVLQDNGGDNISITDNGTFQFPTNVVSGGAFAVSVLAQPTVPSQTCAVTGGTGPVVAAAITGVTVTCTTNLYTVGGTVSGLAGSGLLLQDNGGDNFVVTANGSFQFATPIASGGSFEVTLVAQPSLPTQTCTVLGDSGSVGSSNVTTVSVNCDTNTYIIGGTVTGLTGTVVLQDNGGDNLSVSANGSFAFATPIASGAMYAVAVLTQPASPNQTCNVTNGSDTVGGTDVSTVVVTCVTNVYTIGGTISGLAIGDSVVLRNNGADNATLTTNGTFAFATSIPDGSAYSVDVLTQPASPPQTCLVTNPGGMVAGANVTNVTVNCTTTTFSIGGTLTGVSATIVLQDNGGDALSLSADGVFSFATPLVSGATYAVTLLTVPSGLYCSVTNGTGSVVDAPITTVVVTCQPSNGTVLDVGGTSHPIMMVPCGNGTVTNCVEAVAQTSCTSLGLKLVSHASDGTSSVMSLGATSSCQWSISYFTNTAQALAGQCLIGVSNAYWSSCCTATRWHGNTVTIPATVGQQFGFDYPANSGYQAGLSNVSGTTWGCIPIASAPPARAGCTTYYVACE